MIKENDNIWREDLNFIRSKVNLHAEIVVFGAKIKIGEKVRISEQCAKFEGSPKTFGIFAAVCKTFLMCQSV